MLDQKDNKKIIDRLSSIEGHIRGIKKMLEEEKSCDEILVQFSAVQSALKASAKLLLEFHFNTCVMSRVKNKDLENELNDFKQALDRLIN